jgi:hypothetical protein
MQESTVSSAIMDKYAKTLVSDYNQDLDFFLPPTFSYFPFYSNGSYTAKAIISSNGTALLLYPSDTWSVNNTVTSQRIEESVFGANNFNYPTKFSFGDNSGIYVYGNEVNRANMDIENIGIIINPDSSVTFRNLYINSVFYYFLILKGSNKASYWDASTALNDSRRIFDEDLYRALNQSEAVREHYAEPELDTLLINVLTKWHNQLLSNGTIVYPDSQKAYDIQQIEELAKTKYGITNNEFINETLTYLESVTLPTPMPPQTRTTLGISDPENWIYSTLFGVYLIFLYAFSSVLRVIQKKHPNEDLKFLTSEIL